MDHACSGSRGRISPTEVARFWAHMDLCELSHTGCVFANGGGRSRVFGNRLWAAGLYPVARLFYHRSRDRRRLGWIVAGPLLPQESARLYATLAWSAALPRPPRHQPAPAWPNRVADSADGTLNGLGRWARNIVIRSTVGRVV